jgi:hypothetical protein
LTLQHPTLETISIAEMLYGVDRIESNRKKLCRKINPDDNGSHLNPNELIRLMEILNEGLPAEQRDQKGGNKILHWINKKFGFVAYKQPEMSHEGIVETMEKALRTVAKLQEAITTALMDAVKSGLSDERLLASAVTSFVTREGYDTRASLQSLRSLLAEIDKAKI